MKKLIAFVVLLLLCMSCSVHKVTDPVTTQDHFSLGRPSAQGTPNEGDGGGGGGGGAPACTVNLGDQFNAELEDSFDIPIHINTGDTTGMKGYQVTVTVTGASITGASCGTFLTQFDGSPIFWSGANGDGSYTIIAALNPGHCAHGPNADHGVLFNLGLHFGTVGTAHITLVASPIGAVTPSPTIRDCCCNADVTVTYGSTTTTVEVVNP